ncbi:hypothetical protein ACFFX0_15735 [Citricoccus parietis]|uniref:Uncharacterized protein n=1 Tax=Citricoccus parietis TaxID=592307 RepID=A0ABV5G0X0_9MICC
MAIVLLSSVAPGGDCPGRRMRLAAEVDSVGGGEWRRWRVAEVESGGCGSGRPRTSFGTGPATSAPSMDRLSRWRISPWPASGRNRPGRRSRWRSARHRR